MVFKLCCGTAAGAEAAVSATVVSGDERAVSAVPATVGQENEGKAAGEDGLPRGRTGRPLAMTKEEGSRSVAMAEEEGSRPLAMAKENVAEGKAGGGDKVGAAAEGKAGGEDKVGAAAEGKAGGEDKVGAVAEGKAGRGDKVGVAAEGKAGAEAAAAETADAETAAIGGVERSMPSQEEDKARRRRRTADRINNELGKLIMLPFVADKLFAGDKLNQSMLGFLQLAYPATDVETLQKVEPVLRSAVVWKRKYDYVVDKLKQKIKALSLLPKNAPIVAADGEYARAEEDLRKLSAPGEYQVRYRPFKYLEYDKGEFGEPVRQRDRNYVSPEAYNTDEVALALLRFDFYGFMKAIGKMPTYRDGADETPVRLGNGIAARLLADTAKLGDKKKIYGVLEVKLPEGMYIRGDYLNPDGRPAFVLAESGGEIAPGTAYIGGAEGMEQAARGSGLPEEGSRNVESYRLYQPLASGVEKDGAAKRILAGTVLFPIEIVRADTSKSLRFAGSFRFTLCRADGSCVPVQTHHGLTLPASAEADISLYYNYVMQGVAHLPERESKHVQPSKAVYSPEKQELAVEFAATRSFSNVAVMAEDAAGTNFLAPRYEIGDDYVRAVFRVRAAHGGGSVPELGEIAVSASFNDTEKLRTVMKPEYAGGETDVSGARGAGIGGGGLPRGWTSQPLAMTKEKESLPLAKDGQAPAVAKEKDGRASAVAGEDGNRPRAMSEEESLPFAAAEDGAEYAERPLSGEGRRAVAIPAPELPPLFWYGVLMMLMPGGFYLCFQLVRQMWTRNDRRRIAFWYAAGAAAGLALSALWLRGRYFGEMYQNPWLIAAAAAVMMPLFAESLGYMNSELFRPLKKFMPRGLAAGLFTVLLGMAFPGALKPEALSGLTAGGVFVLPESPEIFSGSQVAAGNLPSAEGAAWIAGSAGQMWRSYALIWCGIAVFTLLVLTLRSRFVYPLEGFRRCNVAYNGVYLAWLLWVAGAGFGIWAAVGLAAGMALLFFLWYVFPLAADEAARQVRSETRRRLVFERVQRHWLAAVLIWFLLVGGGLKLAGLKVAGTAEAAMAAVAGDVSGAMAGDAAEAALAAGSAEGGFDVPLLVAVEADYSPKSLFNRPALSQLARSGIRVVRIDASGNGLNAVPWFAAYGRFYAPLSVLFTARHKYGLVLPENLNDVDFAKAVAGWPQ